MNRPNIEAIEKHIDPNYVYSYNYLKDCYIAIAILIKYIRHLEKEMENGTTS